MEIYNLTDNYKFLKNGLVEGGCFNKFDQIASNLELLFKNFDPTAPATFVIDHANNCRIMLEGFSQGNVSNKNLFGPHELTIFAVYERWLEYFSVNNSVNGPICFCDLGANVGVHSILMSIRGCDCYCVEPIPDVVDCLKGNATSNSCHLEIVEGAIVPTSYTSSTVTFLQVLDNFTASTTALTGKKVYGDITGLSVSAVPITRVLELLPKSNALIIKVDIEGAEIDLLDDLVEALDEMNFNAVRIVLEISNDDSRIAIYEISRKWRSRMRTYSDKTGFTREVADVEELPINWREGSAYFEMDR